LFRAYSRGRSDVLAGVDGSGKQLMRRAGQLLVALAVVAI